jgi:hypothetical protein
VTGFRTSLPAAPERAGWGDPDGHRDGSNGATARLPGSRRRSVPHLAIGALLVVVCALGFALVAGSVDHRRSVLALARPVTVGHALTNADVASVRVSAGTGLATIPASELNSIVGQPVAVSLPTGALLSRAELGPVALAAGQAVVALAVAPGQAPPGLAAGEHVTLVRMPPSGAAAGNSSVVNGSTGSQPAPSTWSGVVTGVEAVADAQGSEVVSIQLPAAQAQQVAALPKGQVDLLLVSGH